MIDHEGLLWSMYDELQLSVKNGLLPQSFSGGGLYLKVKWVTMERVWWVTMERINGYYEACKMGYYEACKMGYYGA